VAGLAFDLRPLVRVLQTKACLVVIKARGLPVGGRMAVGAFFTQVGGVLVVFFVAGYAFLARLLEHGAFVAGLALDLDMLAQQRKS